MIIERGDEPHREMTSVLRRRRTKTNEMNNQIKIEEKFSKRTITCHNCRKSIIMGEKCTKLFKTDDKGNIINEMIYITLCQPCTKDFGNKLLSTSSSIKPYNDILLALPEKTRKLKVRMLIKMDKGNKQ